MLITGKVLEEYRKYQETGEIPNPSWYDEFYKSIENEWEDGDDILGQALNIFVNEEKEEEKKDDLQLDEVERMSPAEIRKYICEKTEHSITVDQANGYLSGAISSSELESRFSTLAKQQSPKTKRKSIFSRKNKNN